MSPQTGDEIMVHDSIEAKGDDDVDMEDAPAEADDGAQERSDNVGVITQVDGAEDGQADGDGDVDADGEAEEEEPAEAVSARAARRRVIDNPQRRLLDLIQATTKYLCEYEENDEPIAAGFQRLPKKNELPDYYEVITNPAAFSTCRNKILRKSYTKFSEFVQDVAQICHNAQVYNRPSAPIFKEAVRLRDIFKEKLQELVKDESIQAEEAVLPDLGELPPVEDSPPPGSEEEDEEQEEDEEDDDDSDDDDDDGGRRRRPRRGRASRKDDDDEDYAKRRGRPPKVFTPTEARIDAILKGLRKPKNDDGDLRVLSFEKLPDRQLNKEYYQAIQNPIALDQIKRNAKRKKYRTLDEFLADLDLMFANAMQYNEEGSDIYDDAVELQKLAHRLVEEERAKSDEAFRDQEGKLPLSEVEHNGEVWRVGDWVHIRNPNDVQKPIVAQICRLWQDEAGRKWTNACWYYRPEQTVHHVAKRFYKNEVMKTGQYRDHLVDDMVDRCFVMFHTRYHRGRPRGVPPNRDVYVCEARYNEDRHTFARIKTWTSCLPDEVRDRDYEMDLFDVPQRPSKEPTPIAHLLAPNARPTDPLPKPNWGHKDAPPIIGGVHMRPREPNDSPSPEPTPGPPAVPPPAMAADPIRRQSVPMAPTSTVFHPGAPGPVPSPSPAHAHHFQQSHFAPPPQPRPVHFTPSAVPVQQHQPQHQQQPQHHVQPHHLHQVQQQSPAHPVASSHYAPQHHHQGYHQHQPQQSHFAPSPAQGGHHHHIPTFQHQQQLPPQHQLPQQHQLAHQLPHHQTPFSHHAAPVPQQRMPMASTPSNTAIPHANAANANANTYTPPRPVEVYHLRDDIDAAIPADVREQYQTDDKGHVLFFAAPPLSRPQSGVAEESATLGHSVRYLSDLHKHRAERDKKRKEREEALERERESKAARDKEMKEQAERQMGATAGALLGDWLLSLKRENDKMENQLAPIRAEKAAWEADKRMMEGEKAT